MCTTTPQPLKNNTIIMGGRPNPVFVSNSLSHHNCVSTFTWFSTLIGCPLRNAAACSNVGWFYRMMIHNLQPRTG